MMMTGKNLFICNKAREIVWSSHILSGIRGEFTGTPNPPPAFFWNYFGLLLGSRLVNRELHCTSSYTPHFYGTILKDFLIRYHNFYDVSFSPFLLLSLFWSHSTLPCPNISLTDWIYYMHVICWFHVTTCCKFISCSHFQLTPKYIFFISTPLHIHLIFTLIM